MLTKIKAYQAADLRVHALLLHPPRLLEPQVGQVVVQDLEGPLAVAQPPHHPAVELDEEGRGRAGVSGVGTSSAAATGRRRWGLLAGEGPGLRAAGAFGASRFDGLLAGAVVLFCDLVLRGEGVQGGRVCSGVVSGM